ncbi:hypothetical protein ACVIIV_002895 [Bradyrhizobium sp. USDA 4354]
MIHRLLHWRWCFGELAAVKRVNDAQVIASDLAHLPMCAQEKAGCQALGKRLM